MNDNTQKNRIKATRHQRSATQLADSLQVLQQVAQSLPQQKVLTMNLKTMTKTTL